ncbi:MAG: hypothetical protein IJ620_01595 [Bacteroidales bacterium]|nr:hypothetical protein [Bacteroidales bacterium]
MYCIFHNPAALAIYDSYFYQLFSQLRQVMACGPYRGGNKAKKDWAGEATCGYALYKKVYVALNTSTKENR